MENTCVRVSFLKLWHRCVPVNFVKLLKTPFLQNTFRRIFPYLLSLSVSLSVSVSLSLCLSLSLSLSLGRIFRSSYRKLVWVGFEPTTTEFRSDVLTDWAIRPWVQLTLRANFVQLLQFHLFLCSVFTFHFGLCLRQSPDYLCETSLKAKAYSVRMRENTDQKQLRIWTLFTQWSCQTLLLSNCKLYCVTSKLRWINMQQLSVSTSTVSCRM